MSKLFPTQEIGSLKKPADMLKKVKDPNASDEEKIKVRNDAALLNIKTFEDIGPVSYTHLTLPTNREV